MIDPKNTTAIKCEECESETFKEVIFLRKVSKMLTGQSQDGVIPIPAFECSKCGHINKEFIPNFNKINA